MGRKPKTSDNLSEVSGGHGLDPIIEGLLLRMPEPGTYWPPQERQAWLTLLQGALAVIYKDKPDQPQA